MTDQTPIGETTAGTPTTENTQLKTTTLQGNAGLGRKYLIFTISGERFAVPLSLVKEVIGNSKITPIPNVPRYFKGLINLRGKIISTIDLREKLKITTGTESKRPCIIISEIEDITVGAIVDDVAEVVGISESQISADLDFFNKENREQYDGAARFENKPLTIILNLKNVIDVESIVALSNQSNQSKAS